MQKKSGTEVLFGIHSIAEALKANRRNFHTIYLSQESASSERITPIKKLAVRRRAPRF